MPFILYQFLNNSSIKNNEAKNIQERIETHIDLVSKYIILYWIYITKIIKLFLVINLLQIKDMF